MSAVLEINVQVNQAQEAAALAELSKIDGIIDKINKKGIDIKINSGNGSSSNGFKTLAQSANEAATAVANAGTLIENKSKSINGSLVQTSSTVKTGLGQTKQTITDIGAAVDEAGNKVNQVTEIVKTNHEKIRRENEKTAKQLKKEAEAAEKQRQKDEQIQFQMFEKRQKRLEAEEKANAKATAEREKNAARAKAAAEKEAKAEQEAADRKIAAWTRAAKVAVAAVAVKATKEALTEMKNVDSELANIRKVTGESAENIAKLGEASYDTASKYGVAAQDYLEAATAFAKAGKSNYAELAELAIKTELAGDVTAETAQKFLLAADAAYKMNGDISQLSLVLDKANELDNNYATSIEKIADGFPIVANTAHMANMSIEELMASLGTITAVTQQTGRKAATALRALILNITGEIGEVVEEEGEEMFTVTEESVANMTDALRKYGSEAVKTSIELGKVIDPMEAIRSLAMAYKNGDLTDTALWDILSGIGGKLRTEQLTALVQNFDMVESQMESMTNAAGSADKEIANLLETWDRKLKQLQNSWTKFVSHILDVDAIKDGIDFLRNAIDAIDKFVRTPFGDAVLRVGALTLGFNKLWKAVEVIQKSSFGKMLAGHLGDAVNAVSGSGGLNDALDQTGNKLEGIDLKALKVKAGLLLIAQEIMAVIEIVNARAEINADRFKHMYGQSTAEIKGFGGQVSEAVLKNRSSGDAAVASGISAVLDQYRETYNRLKNDVTAENSKLFEEEMGFKAEDFIRSFELAEKAVLHYEEAAAEGVKTTDEFGNMLIKTGEYGHMAAKALQEVADASREVKSANADAYRSQYQSFLTDWESGKTDTANVRNAIDLFVTPELQKEMGYNMQAIGEMLANELYQGIFNGAQENSAADFANYLYDNLGEELAGIAKITEEADGTLSFEYASAQKLATALKMPLSVVEALIDALDEYGVEAEMGWEDTEMLAQVLGLMGENAGTAEEQIRNAATALAQMGMQDPYEIQKVISQLGEAGYIDLSNIELPDLGKMISDAMAEVKASGKTELEITASVDGDESVSNLRADIDGIPNSKSSRVVARVSGANDVWGLVSALNNLRDVNVNVNANTNTSGSGSSTVVKPSQSNRIDQVAAEGTKNAKGGATLVNEVGPELISYNGRAYIANGGKPAIVSLGKGAVVLTAEETRNAIGYAQTQRLSLNGQISAAASGIPRSSGSTGLSGGYNAYVDKSSGEDKSEEEIVREEAKALETLAEYYHNMKQHSNEAAAYQEAINKLERIRAWYRANGLTETDTRVAEVANEIFGLQEKINDANSHAIDDLEEELDNLDAQITLAEHQGDAKRALELEKQAQDKIAELIKAYQDAGYSDTSDEILRLVNNGYNYADSSNSRLGDMRKEVIAAIKAMKETQDDANTLAEKQLAVEEARTAYENAQNQRTVRVFNPVTGQWEWVANAKDVADAEKALQSAEEALSQEQQSQELSALEEALENGSSLKDITIGPALAALISGASVNQTNALASALGVLSGGVAATADTSSKSIFDSVDSHDSVTNYTFNGVNIGQAIAETTTLAQLAKMISPLALTGNMPA